MNTFTRTITIIRKLAPRILKYREIRENILKGKEIDQKELAKEAKLFTDALIDLGPTFIKFGQILSVRGDILPEAYLNELQRLQDEVPPAPKDEILKIVSKYIDNIEVGDVIAAASLGQVHLGKYNGKEVAIKVNRPNVEEILRTDIKIMKRLLPTLRLLFDSSFMESLKVVVDLFSKRVFDELDYTKEAQNLEKLKEELKDFDVIIPNVIKATKQVLVMEYVKGHKVTSEESLKIVDKRMLAWRVFKVFMFPLLTGRIFHADPHPGNISITDDGRLILYDFGMIGRIDPETRIKLIRLYLSLSRGDAIMVVNLLDQLGAVQPFADRKVLIKGFQLLIESARRELEEIELQDFNKLASEAFYKFPLRLPERLAAYLRMSAVLEGTCKLIDPDFDFIDNLIRLIQDLGLTRAALIDEAKDYYTTFLNNIKMNLIPPSEKINKRSKKWIGSIIILGSIIAYLALGNFYIAILIAILGLSITLSLP
ncbi:AarF/ABC1/UbiB kinase family protein [Acidianus sulfidivorans JP7]|uniref:Glycosyl transferase family 1 n=1 Tax=Acidianus sulfidivorans JP7 TaxID=619593 RepID=A0A2U9IPB1_9CREN|nr:AarF/UbiB family protein [Acidianus sulfidivorans]AWR97888.1 AarF/ABC1/UbiB kinase family protein [Acidianus sulfidivorans JP7]